MSARSLVAHAEVATTRPERYAKQLTSYLSSRCPVTEEPAGFRVEFAPQWAAGDCLIRAGEGSVDLIASAEGDSDLAFITDTVGGHLEHMGRRDELVVQWH